MTATVLQDIMRRDGGTVPRFLTWAHLAEDSNA